MLIFRSLFVKCEACSIDEYENNPNAYYKLSLVYYKNRKIVVEETKDKEVAFALAVEVASGLKAKLRDSATVRGKVAGYFRSNRKTGLVKEKVNFNAISK